MTVTITLNGVSVQRDIPTSWERVSFKQFLALEKCANDIVKVLALFTGTDYEVLCRSKVSNMDTIIHVLAFLKTPPTTVIPKTILRYPVPAGLEFEQVQQYIDLKNYVQESASLSALEQLERYTLYCAVYACSASNAYGKYDWTYAEKMKDEFLDAPCMEVMGIGNFTLARLIGLKHNIDLTSPKESSARKKFRLALVGWRIRTVLYLRSFNWRKRLV